MKPEPLSPQTCGVYRKQGQWIIAVGSGISLMAPELEILLSDQELRDLHQQIEEAIQNPEIEICVGSETGPRVRLYPTLIQGLAPLIKRRIAQLDAGHPIPEDKEINFSS